MRARSVLFLCAVAHGAPAGEPPRVWSGGAGPKIWSRAEFEIYRWEADGGGTLSHFFITGDDRVGVDNAIVTYYIDGQPDVQFTVMHGCGVGFVDESSPCGHSGCLETNGGYQPTWGSQWVGKGAGMGGWYNNLRVPFRKSFRATIRLPDWVPLHPPSGQPPPYGNRFFVHVRGFEGHLPITVGGYTLPAQAKMIVQRRSASLAALDYYDVLELPPGPQGSGVLALSTLKVVSGSPYFMEGCWRIFSPHGAAWPGQVLTFGMEDYYDSAYYFNSAGGYPQGDPTTGVPLPTGNQMNSRLPSGGLTHYSSFNSSSADAVGPFKSGGLRWSAYRAHLGDLDLMSFRGGVRLGTRNGDTDDNDGRGKCARSGPNATTPIGDGLLTASVVESYAWAYVWPDGDAHVA